MAKDHEELSSQSLVEVEEDTLQELRQYRTVIEILPDPVFVTDESGYLISVNEAFTDLFGFGTARNEARRIAYRSQAKLEELRRLIGTTASSSTRRTTIWSTIWQIDITFRPLRTRPGN